MNSAIALKSTRVKKGWALLRVSLPTETQHGSLEQQRHMIERWQEEQIDKTGCRYDITRILEEDGKSGKKSSFSKRTDFQELLLAVENRQIDFVIFEKVDRMGRWQIANLRLIETAHEQGVEVFFIDDGKFNYRDRGKRLSFNVKNVFAEDYSLELEEKITRKQREAMVNNCKDSSTRPVLGLDPHPIKVGFYVLNKEEQKVVIDIFQKFVELQELYATVEYCNADGRKYKTKEYWIKEKIDRNGNRIPAHKVGGGPFTSESLKTLLSSPKIRGFNFFQDTWNQFEKRRDADGVVRWDYGHFRESGPVVPLELFEQVQSILERNKQKTSKPETNGEVYLLAGVLRLADGTRLVGASADGRRDTYRYYEDRKGSRRAEIRISKEEIEDAVCRRVKEYLKDCGLLERAIQSTFSNLDTEVAKIEGNIKAKETELSRLQKTVDGFSDFVRKAALNGELDRVSTLLASEQQKVDQEIRTVSNQIQILERQKAALKEHYQEKALQEKMQEALADFSKRCDLQKQQIIQTIAPKIIVHRDNRLEIKINPLFKKPDDDGDETGHRFKDGGRRFVLLENGEP